MGFTATTHTLAYCTATLDPGALFDADGVDWPVLVRLSSVRAEVLIGDHVPLRYRPSAPPTLEFRPLGSLGLAMRSLRGTLVLEEAENRTVVTGRLAAEVSLLGSVVGGLVEVDRVGLRCAAAMATGSWSLGSLTDEIVGVDVGVNDVLLKSVALYVVRARSSDPEEHYHLSLDGLPAIDLAPGLGARVAMDFWDHPLVMTFRTFDDAQRGTRGFQATVDRIDLDIAVLHGPVTLSWESAERTLRFQASVDLFSTPVGDVSLTWNLLRQVFHAQLTTALGSIDLPAVGGQRSDDVTLTIEIEWSKSNGVRLVSVSGIPTLPQDLADMLQEALNRSSGGCAHVLKAWFDDGLDISFSVSLPRPIDRNGDAMSVELSVAWKAVFAEPAGIAVDGDVWLSVAFDTPQSLDELPRSILRGVTSNADDVAEAMLLDADFYAGITLVAAKRGGAEAAARMLCRAAKKAAQFVRKLLKRLAGKLAQYISGSIAAMLEYAAAAVAAASTVILSILEEILDILRKLLPIPEGKKQEMREFLAYAEDLIEDMGERIRGQLEALDPLVGPPTLACDDDGHVVASCVIDPEGFGHGSSVVVRFTFHRGAPGQRDGAAVRHVERAVDLSVTSQHQVSASIPMSELLALDPENRFNLSASVVAKQFMNAELADLEASLPDLESDDFDDFRVEVDRLLAEVDDLEQMNTEGVHTEVGWVEPPTGGTRVDTARVAFDTWT